MTEDPAQLCIHVIDDDETFRNSLLYNLGAHGLTAVSWASGEAFLAAWAWSRRGVVSLDYLFEQPGAMNGEQMFLRLMDLRCGMPVVMHSLPRGRDTQLALRIGRRSANAEFVAKSVDDGLAKGSAHAEFVSKQDNHELLAALRRCLAVAPQVHRRAAEERDTVQALLDAVTPAELEVLSLVLQNRTHFAIARELSERKGKDITEGNVSNQRQAAQKKVLGPNPSPIGLVGTLQPLIDSAGAADLVALVVHELRVRLALPDAPTRALLQAALAEEPLPAPSERSPLGGNAPPLRTLPQALDLLQADAVTTLRRWLRWLAKVRPEEPVWPIASYTVPTDLPPRQAQGKLGL